MKQSLVPGLSGISARSRNALAWSSASAESRFNDANELNDRPLFPLRAKKSFACVDLFRTRLHMQFLTRDDGTLPIRDFSLEWSGNSPGRSSHVSRTLAASSARH